MRSGILCGRQWWRARLERRLVHVRWNLKVCPPIDLPCRQICRRPRSKDRPLLPSGDVRATWSQTIVYRLDGESVAVPLGHTHEVLLHACKAPKS